MTAAARATRTTGRELPFTFDPVPDAAKGDPRLTCLDRLVLGAYLRQRRHLGFAPGRACTKEKIAGELVNPDTGKPYSPRTIQRSNVRLKAAGYIVHEPDLNDRTGYRVVFPFLEPIRLSPDTYPSPPGSQADPPPGDSRFSPPPLRNARTRDETQTGETQTTTTRANTLPLLQTPHPSPSSSSFVPTPPESKTPPTQAPAENPGPPAPELVAGLVERLIAVLGIGKHIAAAKIREWLLIFGFVILDLAITAAELRQTTRNPIRTLGGTYWTLKRWRNLSLDEIREEVDALRPQPKPPAVPPPPARPAEPEEPPPDRPELLARIAELEAKPRLRDFETTELRSARDELAKLEAPS